MVVHLLHCSILTSSPAFCSKRQQRHPERCILLNILFRIKFSWQFSCCPVLYTIFHSGRMKYTYMFCTTIQGLIWKPDNYTYVKCEGNSDSHPGQKDFLLISEINQSYGTLCFPLIQFVSFINLCWFLWIFTSRNLSDTTVSSSLVCFGFFLFNLQPNVWINGHGHWIPAAWLGASLHPKPSAMSNQIIRLWLKQKPATSHTKQLGQQCLC